MSRRYYINNIDSYLGQALYRQLYKPGEEEENDNVIIATKTNPIDVDKLPGTKKILKVFHSSFFLFLFFPLFLESQAQAFQKILDRK